MSETTRKDAERAAKLVDKVNAVVLVEPLADIVPLASAEGDVEADIREKMAEVDITDTQTVVRFGARAQSGMQQISQSMLDGVRNKDVGPAG